MKTRHICGIRMWVTLNSAFLMNFFIEIYFLCFSLNLCSVPTDIQAMMYCEMVDWFGEWAYEWMYTQYLTTNDSLQETWFACALGCSKENNSFYK